MIEASIPYAKLFCVLPNDHLVYAVLPGWRKLLLSANWRWKILEKL